MMCKVTRLIWMLCNFGDRYLRVLAKRVDSEVHRSVQELTTRVDSKVPHTKVEIRVLDFDIVE